MVFVLPLEFYAPDCKELPVAQLDFGPRPVIFEKNYKHLKALSVPQELYQWSSD
jgi:hypothetical protein